MIRDTINVSFPAQKCYALLLRTFVAGSAASYDLSVDMLDDLRMAAEEAYDYLLCSAKGDEQLLCDIYRDEFNTVSMNLRLSGRSGLPVAQQESEISYTILKTLMNDVTLFADNAGATGVRMTLKAEK